MFEWLTSNQETATLIFAGIVALSTVVYAILTGILVLETRRLREVQTEPKIAVFIKPREEFLNAINLYVKNIGLGPAYNVSFEIVSDNLSEGERLLIDDFSKAKFFSTGLKYLGPNQQVESSYSLFQQNYESKIKAILILKTTCLSKTERKHEEIHRLDLSELEETTSLGIPNFYSIAQSLEKMQKNIGTLISGARKIQGNTYTKEDRDHEKEERENQLEQLRKKTSGIDDT